MQLYKSVRNYLESMDIRIENNEDYFSIYQGLVVRDSRYSTRIDFEEKRNNFKIYITFDPITNTNIHLIAKLSNTDRNKLYKLANEYNMTYTLSKVYIDNFGVPMWIIDVPIFPGFSASAEGLIQLLRSLLKIIREFLPKFIDATE